MSILFPCISDKRIALAKQIQAHLSKLLQLSVTIGVAETIGPLERLPKAYREARLAADPKSYISHGQIIPFHAGRLFKQLTKINRTDLELVCDSG